jgi:predicted type IV restriction endonuclease
MAVEIKRAMKKFLPAFLSAQKENLNEADTVTRLIKFFEDVLGYDAINEISREAQMKNKFVDLTLRIDGVTKILVEAKRAGEILRDRHIEQAQSYASRNNYKWVVLTNGVVWNLYHLTFDEGIDYQKAFSVDLSDPAQLDRCSELLGLLHRDSIRKGELEKYWERATCLSAASIGRALFTEVALAVIRREIRRKEGVLIDVEELGASLHSMLSVEAREEIGPLKIRKSRKTTATAK